MRSLNPLLNIHPMKLSQSLFVLPLLLAAPLSSCVDTGYYSGPRPSYGSAYFYNGRYYDGGNYQTGVYSYQGRTYNNRYYQNGQYLYGGVHQHHGSQQQSRPDDRNSLSYSPRTDSRYVHPTRTRF